MDVFDHIPHQDQIGLKLRSRKVINVIRNQSEPISEFRIAKIIPGFADLALRNVDAGHPEALVEEWLQVSAFPAADLQDMHFIIQREILLDERNNMMQGRIFLLPEVTGSVGMSVLHGDNCAGKFKSFLYLYLIIHGYPFQHSQSP
jgi:hypothetical protein